jgi:hypothetical protein
MIWMSNNDVEVTAEKYGIKILEANCESAKAQNKQLPTSSYLVTYLDMIPGGSSYSKHYDIAMGKRVDIFDCYYDKLGKDSSRLLRIEWTAGTVNPKLFDSKSYLKQG